MPANSGQIILDFTNITSGPFIRGKPCYLKEVSLMTMPDSLHDQSTHRLQPALSAARIATANSIKIPGSCPDKQKAPINQGAF
jgi:hypothetical protein